MKFPLDYPLTLLFKFYLHTQLSVTDGDGNLIVYVKQKLYKLKEVVTVFGDEQQSQPLFNIKADRIIDFSAQYHFSDQQGISVGSVKRQGMRSLWKARYDILEGETATMSIREENPWVKVMDGLFGGIPRVGMYSGAYFHPAYLVSRLDGGVVLRMQKQPSIFEGEFKIEKQGKMSVGDETRALLSLIMVVLLERRRG